MDLEVFGKSKAVQERRLAIITLEEKGLKPREISNSLREGGLKVQKKVGKGKKKRVVSKDITISDVYNDLKWGRKNLPREAREELWDDDFTRQLLKELKDIKHPTVKLGYYNLILQARRDRRNRAGDYTKKVEISGELKTKTEISPDEHILRVLKELTKG